MCRDFDKPCVVSIKKGPKNGSFLKSKRRSKNRRKAALGLLIVVLQKLSFTRQTLELKAAFFVLLGFFWCLRFFELLHGILLGT
jgi:hypothetical protein